MSKHHDDMKNMKSKDFLDKPTTNLCHNTKPNPTSLETTL